MRKTSLILTVAILAIGMIMLMGGTALANFGPHGGYGEFTDGANGFPVDNRINPYSGEVDPDTDACAACHRAHTATSPITWTDGGGADKSALLIGDPTETQIRDWCYTCHGNSGSGAATDVQDGIYDSAELPNNEGTNYATTQSEDQTILNGGGFDRLDGAGGAYTSSIHQVDGVTTTLVAWGGTADKGGSTNESANTGGTREGGDMMSLDCADCHDVHGSSNYRILLDETNELTSGGYAGDFKNDVDPDPTPWVISNEVGYPNGVAGDLGWRLHRSADDYGYEPDYTEARYARPVGNDTDKGISGWCASCHTEYNTVSSSGQAAYDSDDDGVEGGTYWGAEVRHRHPTNQPLTTFDGDRALIVGDDNGRNEPWDTISDVAVGVDGPLDGPVDGTDIDIPLEHDPATEGQGGAQLNVDEDWMGCLTCHRAHGSSAVMSGHADVASNVNPPFDSNGLDPNTGGVLLSPASDMNNDGAYTTLARDAANDTAIWAIGTLNIDVIDASGFAVNDWIILSYGGANEESFTIAGIAVNVITLNAVTTNVHLSGDPIVQDSVRTQLTADIAAGVGVLPVANSANFAAVGGLITVGYGTGNAENVTVAGTGAGTITIVGVTANAHNGGDQVVALRAENDSDGVSPSGDSALLRADDRGVCERCHNK